MLTKCCRVQFDQLDTSNVVICK